MRSLLLILILILSYHLSDSQQIVLKKGQKIIVKQTSAGDVDMSMGIIIKSNADINGIIEVTGEKQNIAEVNNTLTAINMTMEMMGQKTSYNSDSSGDRDSDLGKAISPSINNPVKFTVHKLTGIVYPMDTTASKNDDNPLSSMMQMSGGQYEALLTDAFFIIGTERKESSAWTVRDSSSTGKSNTKYTLLSVNKKDAHIKFETTSVLNTTMDQQGNQVTVSLNTKTTGEITSDINTSLVSKKSADSDISGTMETMGQSMNISGKKNSVTIYEVR